MSDPTLILRLYIDPCCYTLSYMQRKEPPHTGSFWLQIVLLNHFGDDAGADGAAAFANGEAQALFHGDWGEQLDLEGHGVAGHNHFFVGWQFHLTCNISG